MAGAPQGKSPRASGAAGSGAPRSTAGEQRQRPPTARRTAAPHARSPSRSSARSSSFSSSARSWSRRTASRRGAWCRRCSSATGCSSTSWCTGRTSRSRTGISPGYAEPKRRRRRRVRVAAADRSAGRSDADPREAPVGARRATRCTCATACCTSTAMRYPQGPEFAGNIERPTARRADNPLFDWQRRLCAAQRRASGRRPLSRRTTTGDRSSSRRITIS